MLFQVLSVLPLLGLVYTSAIPPNLPSFCRNLDCPKFTVLHSEANYELRHYEATTWASIETSAATLETMRFDMFMTLFYYIDGNNTDHVKIPMTAPVVTRIAHGQGPNCASNFTMHFMIPHALWPSPIAPTDPRVKVVTLPAMDVYVKSFPGWAREDDYNQMVAELYSSLSSDTAISNSLETRYYYYAGYDGPYTFDHRHNEVWIVKV